MATSELGSSHGGNPESPQNPGGEGRASRGNGRVEAGRARTCGGRTCGGPWGGAWTPGGRGPTVQKGGAGLRSAGDRTAPPSRDTAPTGLGAEVTHDVTDDIADDVSLCPQAGGLVLEMGMRERSGDPPGRTSCSGANGVPAPRWEGRGRSRAHGTPRIPLGCQGRSRAPGHVGKTPRASEGPPPPPPPITACFTSKPR